MDLLQYLRFFGIQYNSWFCILHHGFSRYCCVKYDTYLLPDLVILASELCAFRFLTLTNFDRSPEQQNLQNRNWWYPSLILIETHNLWRGTAIWLIERFRWSIEWHRGKQYILPVHSAVHNRNFCVKYLQSVKPKKSTISLQQIFIIIIPFIVIDMSC